MPSSHYSQHSSTVHVNTVHSTQHRVHNTVHSTQYTIHNTKYTKHNSFGKFFAEWCLSILMSSRTA
jgi:hypothetical protein